MWSLRKGPIYHNEPIKREMWIYLSFGKDRHLCLAKWRTVQWVSRIYSMWFDLELRKRVPYVIEKFSIHYFNRTGFSILLTSLLRFCICDGFSNFLRHQIQYWNHHAITLSDTTYWGSILMGWTITPLKKSNFVLKPLTLIYSNCDNCLPYVPWKQE